MKIFIRPGFFLSIFLMLVLISFIILNSCSQHNIMPESTAKRKITVNTYSNDAQGRPTNNPLGNIKISIVDPSSNETVVSINTDNKGQGQLVFDAPSIGHRFEVDAIYDKLCNGIPTEIKQVVSIYPCCKDTSLVFYFDTTCPPPLKCEDLADKTDTLIIRDQNGSPKITQSVNSIFYTGSLKLFLNSEILPITATFPDGSTISPFVLVDPKPNSKDTLNFGNSLSISVEIDGSNPVGKYEKKLIIQLSCEGHTATLTIILIAEIVQENCDECLVLPHQPIVIDVSDRRNPIGQPNFYNGEFIFKNTKNCQITIDSLKFINDTKEWKATPSDGKLKINQLDNFNIDFVFTPIGINELPDTLRVFYKIGNTTCIVDVILLGKGCVDACPQISLDNKVFNDFGVNNPIYISQNVKFSRIQCGASVVTQNSIPIQLDPDACDNITVSVSVQDTEALKVSSQFYNVSTSSIYLNKGNSATLVIKFTSPTIGEFKDVLKQRGIIPPNTPNKSDSSFTLIITLTPDKKTCKTQTIVVSNILTTTPLQTKPNLLHAYNETSDIVTTPKQLVCWFDKVSNASTTDFIDHPDINPPWPYPPNNGDFYIDVDNNNNNPPAKKEPIIKLCLQGDYIMDCMKLWTTMTDVQFTNVQWVITQLSTAFYGGGKILFSNGCGTSAGGNVNPLQSGQVYIFWSNSKDENGVPCYLGLLWIAGINYGIESDQYHLSGITFQLIYPIVF